jgi:hypothetical protein
MIGDKQAAAFDRQAAAFLFHLWKNSIEVIL